MNQIRFVYDKTLLGSKKESNKIIVADSGNNCIRLIDLQNDSVITIAGICGLGGFKDGPIGKNKLNNPTTIGADNLGNIWIYDKGNRYIRKLVPTESKKKIIF